MVNKSCDVPIVPNPVQPGPATTTFSDVPKELLRIIFFYLTPIEMQGISRTCHQWLDSSKNLELQESSFRKAMQDKLPLPDICFLAWSYILSRATQEHDRRIALLCLKTIKITPKKDRSKESLSFRTRLIIEFGEFLSEHGLPQYQFPHFAMLDLEKKFQELSIKSSYAEFLKGVWCVSRAMRKETLSKKDVEVIEEEKPWQFLERGIQGKNLLKSASAAGIVDAEFFLSFYAIREPAKNNDDDIEENASIEEDVRTKMVHDAATKGSIIACHCLAIFEYAVVKIGYQRLAAESGHVFWQLSMGNELICQKKYEEALEWIGKAALQNNNEAKLRLVDLMLQGVTGAENCLNQLKADGLNFIIGKDGQIPLETHIKGQQLSQSNPSSGDEEFLY